MKKTIASIGVGSLVGIVTSLAGYPVYDFATQTFSAKNTLMLLLCCGITGIIILLIPEKK